ncbi:MAG TPA: DHH family phosphoesterase [Longimicrobiales bacterium]|nr:DHH family phosphoesterase [Longimicrobiales bacterium]
MATQATETDVGPPMLVVVSDGPDPDASLRAGKREVWRWGENQGGRRDGKRFHGDPTEPGTYEWVRGARAVTAVVMLRDHDRARDVVRAIRQVRSDTAALILASGIPDAPGDGTLARPGELRDVLRIDIEEELLRLEAERRVFCLRNFAAGADTVPILVHPDPDPDAVSSAFAVRALLERSPDAMPIVTRRAITRPENRRMTDLLGIRVVEVGRDELLAFDRVIAVDMQPADLCVPDGPKLAVIDHHPFDHCLCASLHDVRPHLGSTATMLTQYFRAMDEQRVGQSLATALLFGIKTDTDGLTRKVTPEDVEAYAFLQERADMEVLNRLERPAYPVEAARAFGAALDRLCQQDDVVVAFAGELTPEASHILADLGDFCLGIDTACWALAAGYVQDELTVSVRHLGAPPGAGALARELAGEGGNGGGHDTMARFSMPVDRGREWLGDEPARALLDAAIAALDRLR